MTEIFMPLTEFAVLKGYVNYNGKSGKEKNSFECNSTDRNAYFR